MYDDESGSYWDHITGEALHGPLKGHTLETWALEYTTVGAAQSKYPAMTLARPKANLLGYLMRFFHRKKLGTKGMLPFFFRRTMDKVDSRLPDMVQGLGVVEGDRARFFPMAVAKQGVVETWGERTLRVGTGEIDKVPYALWEDDTRSMQIFCRWYGFSATWPSCEVAEKTDDELVDKPLIHTERKHR